MYCHYKQCNNNHIPKPGRRRRHQRAAPWASPPGRRSTGSCSMQGGSNCFASWCRSSEKDCGEELITLIMMLLMLMMTKLLTWILATHIMRSPVRAPPPRANKRVTRIASICLRVNMKLVMLWITSTFVMCMAMVLPASLLGATPSSFAPKDLNYHWSYRNLETTITFIMRMLKMQR